MKCICGDEENDEIGIRSNENSVEKRGNLFSRIMAAF